MKLKKIVIFSLIACFLALSGCTDNKPNGVKKESRLPNYEIMKSESIYLNSWYTPTPTDEHFKDMKDAGFDYIFILGSNVGNIGDARIDATLDLCDKYGIKAFVDCGDKIDNVFGYTKYLEHESFVGFNIDEPILDYNTINKKQGIREIGQKVESFENLFKGKDFLINLNPFDCFHVFSADYSYDEYINGVNENFISKVSSGTKWLSADSYVLHYNESSKKNKNILLDTWLYQLDLMANFKAENEGVKTNMFIQSISYTPLHARPVITKEDLKMQLYCCVAFNFDMISYYCYESPVVEGHSENALLDRNGNKTATYDYAKELNEEIRELGYITRQFNNFQGAYTGIGSKNVQDEEYNNKTLGLKNALTLKQLGEIKSIDATRDYLISFVKDDNGNAGYTVVNYNETSLKQNNDIEITFKNADKAIVYHNGEKKEVELSNHKLTLNLGVGDGAFVIPDYY